MGNTLNHTNLSCIFSYLPLKALKRSEDHLSTGSYLQAKDYIHSLLIMVEKRTSKFAN